jgi:fatty-acyl-CoA synthase
LSVVAQAAIVTQPHSRYNCTLHAFLALHEKAEVEDIRQQLAAALPHYMIPYEFIIQADLPKTSTGKIDRVLLQQSLAV